MDKHDQYPLELRGKARDEAQKVINRLWQIPRTGWRDRNVKNPETVGEHTDALVNMAESLFDVPGLNIMLKIHDWAESEKEIGDIRTDSYCPIEKRWTPEKKAAAELAAMKKICKRLESVGAIIFVIWNEYEKRETERAKIAYQLDKLQAILKAIEYQKNGETVIAQEFITNDAWKISHPSLKKILDKAILKI